MDKFKPDINFTADGELLDEARLAWRARWFDKLVWAQAEVLTKAKDYSNFIIVAGYAAFFGLWAGLAADVSRPVRMISGGLIGLSLLLFVFWELVSMHDRMQAGRRLGKALGSVDYPDDFAEVWDAAMATNSRSGLRLLKIWPWVFYPTAITGLAGGGLLAGMAFVAVAFSEEPSASAISPTTPASGIGQVQSDVSQPSSRSNSTTPSVLKGASTPAAALPVEPVGKIDVNPT